MDYGYQTFQIRNSAVQIFTAPYRCLVVFSDLKYDDVSHFTVSIQDLQQIQGGAQTTHDLARGYNQGNIGDDGNDDFRRENIGCYILRAGQRLSLDSIDDFDITVNYFRLPEL